MSYCKWKDLENIFSWLTYEQDDLFCEDEGAMRRVRDDYPTRYLVTARNGMTDLEIQLQFIPVLIFDN